MNRDETAQLLRTRSALTSQPYGDEAIDAWHEALSMWRYELCRTALMRAAKQQTKITVAHLIEQLPPAPAGTGTDAHRQSCICGGRGWIEVEQTNERHSWWAWQPCPDGPRTGFIES